MSLFNKTVFTLLLVVFVFYFGSAQISINTNGSSPNASAMLDVSSSDKGLLIPRMNSADRENILNPAKGLMVYDSTTNSFWYYNLSWSEMDKDRQQLSWSSSDSLYLENGSGVDLSVYLDNTDHQAIDSFYLFGNHLRLSLENDEQSTQTLDLSSFKDNTDDQTIDVFSLSANSLELSLENDGQSTQTLDLSSFKDNTDNQTIDNFSLLGNSLRLSLEDDGEGLQSVDLSSFKDNTDNQTIDNFSLSGNSLRLSLEDDGEGLQSVDLSSFKDNTDNQVIDVFSLSGNNLQLSLESDGQSTKSLSLSSFKQTLGLSNDNLSISGGNSIALNSAFLSNSGVTYATDTNDDFVFGTNSLNHSSGTEMKFFFDNDKGAFRAGTVTGTEWDDSNVGDYSFAAGYDCIAADRYAIAMGFASKANQEYSVSIGGANTVNGASSVAIGTSNSATGSLALSLGTGNKADGDFGVAIGDGNEADGECSIALGTDLNAASYGEVALGIWNTTYTPNSTSSFNGSDRLLVVGNGTASNDKSNALVINKEGRSHFDGDAFGSNEYVMTIDNTRNNSTSPNNGLLIMAGHNSYNNSHQSSFIRFFRPDGTNCGRIRQDGGSAVKLVDSSDERLKENIKPTQYGIEEVLKIEVKDYNFITDDDDFVKTGFLAQQLHKVYPTAVTVGDDVKTNPWGVTYADLTPLLVKGMQDQQDLIKQQSQEIKQLQDELDEVKTALTKVNQLEQQYAEMKAMLTQMQNSSHPLTNN
ncbi:MAG: tail fiber domain-containing protein [Bacteroidota bacterium]